LLLYSPMKVRARQSRNMSATLTMLRWYLAKQVSSSRFPFPPSSRKPPSPSPLRWNASGATVRWGGVPRKGDRVGLK
jgi:hypothetical protein